MGGKNYDWITFHGSFIIACFHSITYLLTLLQTSVEKAAETTEPDR